MIELIKPPFPWFGGKRRVSSIVWKAFGDVSNYVEPFFGSGAVMLNRPTIPGKEIINDKDHWIANFWRAVQKDPESVAKWADNPVNEDDLTARHIHLVKYVMPELSRRIMADPEYFDAKAAGWWVWGICCWIGSGWCSGTGPWTEVNRQLVHLGDGRGVNRQLVHLGNDGQGVNRQLEELIEYFTQLSNRLARVSVCAGDWRRVVTDGALNFGSTVGVFLDPPYTAGASRQGDLYNQDSLSVGIDVYNWAMENASNPRYRIALCGYEGEYDIPTTWQTYKWKAGTSYQSAISENDNRKKERIWFSPNCLPIIRHKQSDLFEEHSA